VSPPLSPNPADCAAAGVTLVASAVGLGGRLAEASCSARGLLRLGLQLVLVAVVHHDFDGR
jgi:hypothetical protein